VLCSSDDLKSSLKPVYGNQGFTADSLSKRTMFTPVDSQTHGYLYPNNPSADNSPSLWMPTPGSPNLIKIQSPEEVDTML
jgi:hypothetical protein